MQLAFVAPASVLTTASIKRPTLRVRKSQAAALAPRINHHDGVDSYMRQTEYRTDTVHTQNLEFLDRAYDFDEFGDIDNEFDGLTIVEAMDDADLWRFCTGYDVL